MVFDSMLCTEWARESKEDVGRLLFRFLSSEVRDEVWRNRSKLKNSVDHSDTYITEDFAREIQVERKILITHFYFSMFFVISAAI